MWRAVGCIKHFLAPTTPKENTLSRDITISHPRFKNDTCVCEEGTYSSNPEDEKEILSWINFEDQLQNQVYVKKCVFRTITGIYMYNNLFFIG